MSKKKLNTSGVLNELSGQSVFFQRDLSPSSQDTKKDVSQESPDRTKNRTEQRPEYRTENRTEMRTVHLPIKRRTKRYSFEFFEDQITKIRTIKIETELAGDSISLSEIAREALDHYFETVRKTERSE